MKQTPHLLAEAADLRFIQTDAVRQATRHLHDPVAVEDLLFLESWEIGPIGSIAAVLRAAQIRRANPDLAARIREEVRTMRDASSAHTEALRTASVQFTDHSEFLESAL